MIMLKIKQKRGRKVYVRFIFYLEFHLEEEVRDDVKYLNGRGRQRK